jgi:hypothetical protein
VRVLLAVLACVAVVGGMLVARASLGTGPDPRPAGAAGAVGTASGTTVSAAAGGAGAVPGTSGYGSTGPGTITPGATGSGGTVPGTTSSGPPTPGSPSSGSPSTGPPTPGSPTTGTPTPGTPTPGPPGSGTTVSVGASELGAGWIGDQYIGLSFESNSDTGGVNSGRFDTVGNLAQLMRNLGTGVIRFGGNSVDRHYAGASAAALAGLARLARATGWSVLYSEDLAQYDAAAVSRDVSHVSAALDGYLAGIDCGNEPDQYRGNGHRPASYTESQYIAEDAACLRGAAAAAPGVALAGPDTIGTSWLPAYGAQRDISVQWVNQHYYPTSCAKAGTTDAQLVSSLLSPEQVAREAGVFTATRNAAAAQSALPRISETDSAACDSAPGIANTYAAALWAIDYMLTGAEDGMDGMNFHTGLNTKCAYYSPLCGTHVRYQYAPQAEYYGLLFTHLLGAGQLLPVRVQSGLNVTAFALTPFTGGGPHIMVENLSATPTTAALQVGGNPASATVLSLTAPSPLATRGITIQGAQVAADGSFTPGAPDTVGCAEGTCTVTIAPYTAVIVAVG